MTPQRISSSGADVELRMTFVLFFPDGSCGLVRSPGGLELPSGDVDPEEDELEAVLRIPLMSAGFRAQRFHPFDWDGSHLYAWVEGDRYAGQRRPHRNVPLHVTSPDEAVRSLRAQGDDHAAGVVAAATRSYRGQSDADYYADNVEVLERAYRRATTVEGGSGFGGTPAEWRAAREPVLDGIDRDGTFLDVGCANGLLMESARRWCGERGVAVEPYGVDLAPGLVELARARLPQWADRIWLGNAIDWVHPGGMRFDFVHALLDSVPPDRYGDLVAHLLAHVVAADGRLLLSHYVPAGTRARTAAEVADDLGHPLAGQSFPYTVWLGRP